MKDDLKRDNEAKGEEGGMSGVIGWKDEASKGAIVR